MPCLRASSTERKWTLLAAHPQLAPVRCVEAAQDLDERALAGSVVADEPEHLALAQLEVDAAEDDEGAEALGDAAHLERPVVRRGRGRRGVAGRALMRPSSAR